MKRWLRGALIVGVLACGPVGAQVLWGGVQHGMTINEVAAALENANPVKDGHSLSGGAVERLRVDGLEIVGREFQAGLFFQDDKLQQVTLRPSEPLSLAAADTVADSLIEALRARYGPELTGKSSIGPIITRDYTWISGKTNISLVMAAIGEAAQILNVSYQVRIMEDAAKL